MANKGKLTKKELATELGVSVSSLYYKHKRPLIDLEVKNQIEAVLVEHPAYGHKRIALTLKLNKKRILRVMKKYGIKPYRRRAKKRIKKNDLNKPETIYTNLLFEEQANRPNKIWVSDFTYIKYKEKFIYLATVMDLFTREIVGINISRFHKKELVMGALQNALENYPVPEIIHSDQGSEYDSKAYTDLATGFGIKISMSNKGSPWENGYQESFYSHFKLEGGDLSRFEEIGELLEHLYTQIWYYNNARIHTSLKMTPKEKRESFYK